LGRPIAFLTGQYAAAGQAWQRCLAIQEKLPAPKPALVQPGVHMLGGLYRDQYDFPRAEEFLKRALDVREKKASERKHPETANILVDAWPALPNDWRLRRAEAHFLRALGMYERAGAFTTKHVVGETLSTLGQLYWRWEI